MKNKSIPEILIWILYGLAAGCGLFLTAMRFAVEYGYGTGAGMIAGAVSLAVLGLVSYIAGRFREKRSTEQRETYDQNGKKWIAVAVESLVVVALLVVMVFVRATLFTGGSFWSITTDPTYEMALVSGEQKIPQIAHGGREIYVHLLQGCMLFLGNKPMTVVVLQIFLLAIAALAVYFSVRRGGGRFAAVLTVAFLGFAPFMLKQTCAVTSFLLVTAIYALALDCIFSVSEKEGGTVSGILRCVVSGLLMGVCCYLDMAGITLLVFLTAGICFGRKEEKNMVLYYVVNVLCMAAGYMGCHALRGIRQEGILTSVNRQLALYAPGRFTFPAMMPDSRVLLWDIPVIAVLMAIGIYTFWMGARIGRKAVWLLAAGLLLLMQCFGMNEPTAFNAYGLFYLFCVVMAGMSAEELFAPAKAVESVNAEMPAEPEMAAAEPAETPAAEPVETAASESATVAPEPAETPAAEPAETPAAEPVETAVAEPAVAAAEPAPEAKKEIAQIQYIENPLPLPKKRERKTMDYDYEVADDDDFDIP